MQKSFLLITIIFLLPLALLAQTSDEHPKAEIFGGYSYLSSDVSFPGGWDAQATGYFTRHFGVTADFSGHYSGQLAVPGGLEINDHKRVYTYLFGPTYAVRHGKHAVFVHALFGGAHSSGTSTIPITVSMFPPTTSLETINQSSSAFAMAIGGGLDLGLMKHLAVRVGQVDWLYTRFQGPSVALGSAAHNFQKSFRYSGGVVFRF